jgi:hypothetical protein
MASIKDLATKGDLKKLATQEDLKETNRKFDGLVAQFLRLDVKIDMLKNDLGQKIESNTAKLIDRMDFAVGRIGVFDRQSTFNGFRLSEIEPIVKNHEARIEALESERKR